MELAVFAIAMDSTALTVALPQIQHAFRIGVSDSQWVITPTVWPSAS
jgi:hypothetical protein